MSAKLARVARRLDLIAAQLASAQGRHDDARELFAKHGIGYCPSNVVAFN